MSHSTSIRIPPEIAAAISKAEERKRQREMMAVARKRESRQKRRALVVEQKDREMKERLASVGIDAAGLGLSDKTSATLASFMAHGVASVVYGVKGRCCLTLQLRRPDTVCLSCPCNNFASTHFFMTTELNDTESDRDGCWDAYKIQIEPTAIQIEPTAAAVVTPPKPTTEDLGDLDGWGDALDACDTESKADESSSMVPPTAAKSPESMAASRSSRVAGSWTPPGVASTVYGERGIDEVTLRADRDIAKQLHQEGSVFAIALSKPLKDRELGGTICISAYPPKFCPSVKELRAGRRKICMKKSVIEEGKKTMLKSKLGGPELSEDDMHGSSSTYHTMLLHAPGGAGLSIIYYLQQSKFWWLSYLTTPDARENESQKRRGYGRMIMWRWINLACATEGVEELYLEVKKEWHAAVNLYKSLQFDELDWRLLPEAMKNYTVEVPKDPTDPQSKMRSEHVYKHYGDADYMLMRLQLSVFQEVRSGTSG